jgi:2-polyprenyl-3-methyl-5-hydroxy-6-metoxy-1,4-benzoquinol methylase/exonuclease VII small subunit
MATAPLPLRHASHSFTAVPAVATDELNDTHSLAVHAIGPGACVLDVGCGFGTVARRLVDRGCRVLGVEIDPRAAEAAESCCERVVLGDAEALDFDHTFSSDRFDVVLFLDVLEHLREPGRVLRRIQRLLTPSGRVFASIPNVAHGAVRLQLLDGRFRYGESGLLDRGHLRFFDAEAVERLFADAGYQISLRARIERALADTEIPIDLDAIPAEVLRSLEEDPDALTYQFFVIAAPHSPGTEQLPVPPERNLIDAHRAQVRELVRLVREGEGYRKKLEGEVAHKETHIGRLEEAVRQHEDGAAYTRKIEEDLAHKETHIGRLEEAVRQHEDGAAYTRKIEEDLAQKETHIRRLEEAVRQHEDGAALARNLAEELTRKNEYLGDVESELGRRITELETAHEEQACLERELLIRNEYLSHLQADLARAEGRLGGIQAEIQVLEAAKREGDAMSIDLLRAAEERVAWLEDVVQQPRHLLSDRVNSWMKRRVPTVHRLLRPLVLALWQRSKK